MSQQIKFWLAVVVCILLNAGTAAAGIYWLPDYLKDNVDSNYRTETDKGGGDNHNRTCEITYGQLSSCPSPQVVKKEFNYGSLVCYTCKCPANYQTQNCSVGWHPVGTPCIEGGITFYTGCAVDACPPGFTAGKVCGEGYIREVNGISGSQDCVFCRVKECASGYTAGLTDCQGKSHPDGWTYHSNGYSGENVCGKCEAKTCTGTYTAGLADCSGKGWIYESSGYAGDEACGQCTAKSCVSGYEAGVSQCSDAAAWDFSGNGYSGDLPCGLCTAKPCDDLFIEGLADCSSKSQPSGWSYVKGHNSGSKACGKCEVKPCAAGTTGCASGLIPVLNNYFSGDQPCYSCQTCEDMGKKTCNSGCISTSECCGGCNSGEACKNGSCVVLTCEGILTDRGYGLNTNLPNKTNVIMNDMTFARMEGTSYIGIDNFTNISQCRGRTRPKLTFNKVGNLDKAGFTNLNLFIKASDTGNIEIRNTLTLKNTVANITPTTINVPSGARIEFTDSKILRNNSPSNTLKVYGGLSFYGTSETGNIYLYDSGNAYVSKVAKVNSISANSASSSITVAGGGKLEAAGSTGVNLAAGKLTMNGSKSYKATLTGTTVKVSGTMKAPYSTINLSGDFIVNSGGSFSANNSSVSAYNGKLYNGASVSIANAVNMSFSGKFSSAVSKITLGTCDSLSPQNNDNYGISAYEFEMGRIDGGNAASNAQISLCGGSKMSFNSRNGTISGSLNQYNNAKICLEYWATFYCKGNLHGEVMKQGWIINKTGMTWQNCSSKRSTSTNKC